MSKIVQTTFVFLLVSLLCHAQTVTGVISGSVLDSSSLAVPGAEVTLTNEATRDQRTTNSDALGDFVFLAVSPGRYSVEIEAPGFKKLKKTNLNVTASERLSVGGLELEIGELTESVSVTAEGTPVQTASQERSALLTNTQMGTLMSRSREYLSLLRVLPGVVYGSYTEQDAMSRSLGPTIQGVRNGFNSMSVDGLPGNDLGSPEWLGSPMNMDAISEVKVLLNNYQSEYGRNAGAVINAVTKSGTQAFHGSGYI